MLFYKSIKLHLCVMILIVYHCSTSVDGGKHGPEFIQKLCDGGDDEIEELAQVMQCEKKVLPKVQEAHIGCMKEVFGAEKLETAKDVKVFLCDKKHQEKFLDFKECVEEKEKADGEVISQEEFWRKIDECIGSDE